MYTSISDPCTNHIINLIGLSIHSINHQSIQNAFYVKLKSCLQSSGGCSATLRLLSSLSALYSSARWDERSLRLLLCRPRAPFVLGLALQTFRTVRDVVMAQLQPLLLFFAHQVKGLVHFLAIVKMGD